MRTIITTCRFLALGLTTVHLWNRMSTRHPLRWTTRTNTKGLFRTQPSMTGTLCRLQRASTAALAAEAVRTTTRAGVLVRHDQLMNLLGLSRHRKHLRQRANEILEYSNAKDLPTTMMVNTCLEKKSSRLAAPRNALESRILLLSGGIART